MVDLSKFPSEESLDKFGEFYKIPRKPHVAIIGLLPMSLLVVPFLFKVVGYLVAPYIFFVVVVEFYLLKYHFGNRNKDN